MVFTPRSTTRACPGVDWAIERLGTWAMTSCRLNACWSARVLPLTTLTDCGIWRRVSDRFSAVTRTSPPLGAGGGGAAAAAKLAAIITGAAAETARAIRSLFVVVIGPSPPILMGSAWSQY